MQLFEYICVYIDQELHIYVLCARKYSPVLSVITKLLTQFTLNYSPK